MEAVKKRRMPKPPGSKTMRLALRRAASGDNPAARDLAYTMAERQRDAQTRTSPGYAAYMKSKR